MKDCARYVGRVGVLAVALGIGTAAIEGAPLALADGDETSTINNNGDDNGAPRDSLDGDNVGHDAASTPGAPTTRTPGRTPGRVDPEVAREKAQQALNDRLDKVKNTLDRTARRIGINPGSTVLGANTAFKDTRAPEEPAADQPPAGAWTPVEASATVDSPPPTENNAPNADKLTAPVSRLPERVVAGILPDSRSAAPVSERTNRYSEIAERTARSLTALIDPSARDRASLTTATEHVTGFATLAADDSSGNAAPQTVAFAAPNVPALTTPQSAPIGGLLSVLSLGTFLAPNAPATPAQVSGLWAVLAWVRRQFDYTFTNKTNSPSQQTVAVQLESPTTTHTFNLAPDPASPDPDGDTVTYQPGTYTSTSGATLVVAADGSAVYTPSAAWNGNTAATDTFTVTTTDEPGNPWHVHGIGGLLNAVTFGLLGNPGHTSTHTVTVDAAPTAHQATVGTINHAGDGAVTGTIGWTPPGGGAVTYSNPNPNPDPATPNTWTTTGGGSVTVDEDGTFTYTPSPWQRLNAYTHPDQNTDSFSVDVTDESGATRTLTVGVPVAATGAAITSSTDSELVVPSGISYSNVGADGTVVLTTRTGTGSVDDPYQTTVTVFRPDGTTHTSTPIAGRPYNAANDFPTGGVRVGADGTVTQTTYAGSGSVDDPYQTTVTVFRPDGVTQTTNLLGRPHGDAKVGVDGTVAQTTYTGSGSVDDPYRTTVTVLRPDATDFHYTNIDGQPGGSWDGPDFQGAQVGADGTVAQTTTTGSGTADDPYKTTVTVLHPDGDTHTSEPITGNPRYSAEVGADGTVAQTTVTGNASGYQTMVTVLRPDGTIHTSTPVAGQPYNRAVVGADGTVAQTIDTWDSTAGYQTTVTVLRANDTTYTGEHITGRPDGIVQVGADGTVAQTTYTGSGSTAVTTVTVLRPNGTTHTSAPITGLPPEGALRGADGSYTYLGVPQVGPDGSVAQSTYTWNSTTGYDTTLTVLRPDGTVHTSGPISGDSLGAAVGADGTFVQTTYTGNSTSGYQTTVTVLRPDATDFRTFTITGGPAEIATFGADGTITQTTRTGNATDGYVYTVSVITLADAPASGLDL